MDWQNTMPTALNELEGQVILLEAESGQVRRELLQHWLNQMQKNDVVTWLLSCNYAEGGPWAGVRDLLNKIIPEVQTHMPNLMNKHDYELASVLPGLRRTLTVRNPTLTDTASDREKVRNYPADRAYRVVHGLVDFLAAWYQYRSPSNVIIVCDEYDHAAPLVRRFFKELMCRRGQALKLVLLTAVDLGKGAAVADQFESKYLKHCVQLNLPSAFLDPIDRLKLTQHVQSLEEQIGEDSIELEIYLPQLIQDCQRSGQWDKALDYQIKACAIFTRRGFYEDGLAYGENALKQLEHYYPEDLERCWVLSKKLYGCYAALNRPLQALQVIEQAMSKITRSNHLLHLCYMMSMLYARFLPQTDLVKAEAYLEQGLQEIDRADLSNDLKQFHTAFNRNGLALIRHRQGRSQEAVELCQSCYQTLDVYLKPNDHLLHRSVLLFNIAQVYASLGANEKALVYLTKAMAMDPNYSEYYNDRGNLYFKLGQFQNAMSDYLHAIDLSPPYPEVWLNLGQCYRHLGCLSEAIDAYSTSLDLDPDQFPVLVARAQTFEMLQQWDAALVDYSAALSLNSQQSFLLANRATLYYDAGEYQNALKDLNQAISISPEVCDLYQNRAVALTALRRFEAAAQDLITYLRLNPEADDRPEVESQLLALQLGANV